MTTQHIDSESERRHKRSLEEIEMRDATNVSANLMKIADENIRRSIDEIKSLRDQLAQEQAKSSALQSQLAQQASALKQCEEMLEECKFLAAHGVGSIGGEKENQDRNISEIRRIIGKINTTLASLRAGREG